MTVRTGLSAFRRKAEARALKWSVLASVATLLGTAAAFPARADQYQYDVLGRLIKVTYASGAVVQYSYDSAGNRTTVSSVLTPPPPPPPPPPPANRPPVAVNDEGIEVARYTTDYISVLDNDSDPDSDPLTITSVSGSGASIGGGGSYIIFNAGSVGYRTLSYSISDGRGGTASATVEIFVYRDFGLAASSNEAAKEVDPEAVGSVVEPQSAPTVSSEEGA